MDAIQINLPLRLSIVFDDVTSDRSFGVTYTNTTDYPMLVEVSGEVTEGKQGTLVAYIGELVDANAQVSVASLAWVGDSYINFNNVTFLVPPHWVYKVSGLADVTLQRWVEWTITPIREY